MFFVLLEITVVVCLLLMLFVSVKYVALVIAKHNADKAFSSLFGELLIFYESVNNIVGGYEKYIQGDDFVKETRDLISKAILFTIEKDGNERIVGFANAIIRKIGHAADAVIDYNLQNNVSDLKDVIDKFLFAKTELDKEIFNYNNCAKKLKYYVDVFPTSLICRFKHITTMDYIN